MGKSGNGARKFDAMVREFRRCGKEGREDKPKTLVVVVPVTRDEFTELLAGVEVGHQIMIEGRSYGRKRVGDTLESVQQRALEMFC